MRRGVFVAALLPLGLVGCAVFAPSDTGATGAPGDDVAAAVELLKVTSPHESTGGTLLEGPTFDSDGALYVVDIMAPPGEPKVLRIHVDEATVETVYTDDRSAFTSAQVHPGNGRLYLTDILSGSIVSMSTEGTDVRTEFAGEVDGTRMLPDDLTFDRDGNMFVTDTTGMQGPGWQTPGRVVRIGAEGRATEVAVDLPSPNGIAFDENDRGLWVAQYNANRIDYFALDETGESVAAAYPAIHVDAGRARVDSTAVDADGNIYQAFHNETRIDVYAPTGALLRTIDLPDDGLESATNIAIAPGTSTAYVTVSGADGGFIYTFPALAEGTRQSNGG